LLAVPSVGELRGGMESEGQEMVSRSMDAELGKMEKEEGHV